MIIRRISNSEIQSFKRCPRQWWLAWVRGLMLKYVSPLGALAIGGRIHEALALYYVPNRVKSIDPRNSIDILLRRDLRLLASASITEEDRKRFEAEADLQRIMLDGYMQWIEDTGADQDYIIEEPESYVEAPFSTSLGQMYSTQLTLIGRLDVRLRSAWTDQLLFLDHKTTASISASIKSLRMNPQMRMYRLILQLASGETVGGAVYSMLRKVKRTVKANPPFYQRETLTFNSHELVAFEKQLYGTISEMLRTEEVVTNQPDQHHIFVPPTVGSHCDRCVFQRECPMFDDGSRVEDALNARFTVGEPLHYYGKDDLKQHDDTDADTESGRGSVHTPPRRIEAG